jgi:hypothetical protein
VLVTGSGPSPLPAAQRGCRFSDVYGIREVLWPRQLWIARLRGNDVDVKVHDDLPGDPTTGVPERDVVGAKALLHHTGEAASSRERPRQIGRVQLERLLER